MNTKKENETMSKRKNEVKWLRISYWAGVIGDFALAIFALIPKIMDVPSYVYPMGMFSAVTFSWGCMLIWADREPLERRWVLLPTILVGSMLLLANIISMFAGVVTFEEKFYTLILYPAVIALWSYSYMKSKKAG
jgi:hypothetical protein